METFGKFVVVIGVAFIATIARGWVLTKLWAWFVVTEFGVPMLSIPVAIGLAMILSYVTYQATADSDDYEKKSMVNKCLQAILLPFTMLLFGWIVTLFM